MAKSRNDPRPFRATKLSVPQFGPGAARPALLAGPHASAIILYEHRLLIPLIATLVLPEKYTHYEANDIRLLRTIGKQSIV